MTAKLPRNRLAQDATLYNINALKKRMALLEVCVKANDKIQVWQQSQIDELSNRIDQLEFPVPQLRLKRKR